MRFLQGQLSHFLRCSAFRNVRDDADVPVQLAQDIAVTVLQAAPGFSLQTIAAGRYLDRFERRHGQWRFTERRVHIDLVGDLSHHLHRAAAGSDARSGK